MPASRWTSCSRRTAGHPRLRPRRAARARALPARGPRGGGGHPRPGQQPAGGSRAASVPTAAARRGDSALKAGRSCARAALVVLRGAGRRLLRLPAQHRQGRADLLPACHRRPGAARRRSHAGAPCASPPRAPIRAWIPRTSCWCSRTTAWASMPAAAGRPPAPDLVAALAVQTLRGSGSWASVQDAAQPLPVRLPAADDAAPLRGRLHRRRRGARGARGARLRASGGARGARWSARSTVAGTASRRRPTG